MTKKKITSKDIAKALAATTDWNTYSSWSSAPGDNLELNNSSGFSGLPSGFRYYGGFLSIGYYGIWWSSTVDFSGNPKGWELAYNYDRLRPKWLVKRNGHCIRCVKD